MAYEATLIDPSVVFDDPQTLPESTRVEAIVKREQDRSETLQEVLLQQAGCMTDLPTDLGEQHDHYIHGMPKR